MRCRLQIQLEESVKTTNLLRQAFSHSAATGTGVSEEGTSIEMESMNLLIIIFAVIFGLVFFLTLGTSGFVFFNVFRVFNRALKNADQQQNSAKQTDHAEKKRKALEIVAQQPPGSPAFKCHSCGATVDSTAELSPDGRVRCNYCNQWTSIYQ